MKKNNAVPVQTKMKSAYSKALAKAILLNENRDMTSDITFQDIKDTYRALCFDDPIVDNDLKCRSLAVKLINGAYSIDLGVDIEFCNTKTLGLSDPFVRGVLSATQRDQTFRETMVSSDKPSEEKHKYSEYSGEMIVQNSIASQGYADLAFVVFLLGPLQIIKDILSSDHNARISWARSFLGGYSGSGIDTGKAKNSEDSDVKDEIKSFFSAAEINTQDDNSMREIFAEESDPDDYDFGDDRYQTDPINNRIIVLDAESLSEPQFFTNTDIKHRIKSLLNELTYNRISTMSKKLWKIWNVSKFLSESVLTLLKCLDNVPGFDLEDLAFLHTKPLFVLRDRAFDDRYECDCFDDYIELIKTLLHSDSSQVGRAASKADRGTLSSSQIIGLSSLSELCSSLLIQSQSSFNRIKKVRSFIFKFQYCLVDCIESVRPTNKAPDKCPTLLWMRVVLGLIPILDVISNSRSRDDHLKGHETRYNNLLSAEEAQKVMQSGLLRELILMYTETHGIVSKSDEVEYQSFARRQLLRNILTLCSLSPKVLLKYTSRVPAFTKILYSNDFMENNIGDCIIWYAVLGNAHECATTVMLMKSIDTKSKDELYNICSSTIINLCELLRLIIEQGAALTSEDDRATNDFIWLLDFLQEFRYAMECMADVGLGDQKILDSLSCILQSINTLNVEPTAQPKNRNEKMDNNVKTVSSRLTFSSDVIAKIRKGCKYLILSLEERKIAKNSSFPHVISSKTD